MIVPLLIVPTSPTVPGGAPEHGARDERRLLAVADHVAGRERRSHRVEAERVPAELPEALDRQVVARAVVERHHRRRTEDLLQLHAGLVRAREVDRIDDVDAAVDEDVLAPAQHLVADLHLGGLVRELEVLRHPDVEQRDVVDRDVLGVVGERRALGVVGRRVVEPREAAERAPAVAELQHELVVALERARDELVLLVVEIAVVRLQVVEIGIGRGALIRAIDQLAERTGRRRAAAVVVADDAAARRRHPPLHAE